MTLISKFIILSLFVTLFYFIGLLTFITDYEENKCEMTYMFEYPQFVKIKMPQQELFPRYGLYVYSEGKLTEKARAMRFEGIPIVFVPGNAGSFKQVRSVASIALRKALNSHVGYHFDFFTLDLNSELSGLNGAVLEDQTQFLNHSLDRILALYDKKHTGNAPTSVIVIGHSMGGVLGQSLLNNPQVNMLITLAAPHRRPMITLDSFTAKYYEHLKHISNTDSKTVISIGGGYQDHLVNSWLTNYNMSSLNVITTSVPKVWLSSDHACIVWCKQFILTLVRALFDCVDLKTRQISLDPKYRLNVFKHYLQQNSGTNIRWSERYKVLVRFDDRGEWKEDTRKQYSVNLPKGTYTNQWHMIKITDDLKSSAVFIQANNLAVTDWIFACEANYLRGTTKYCQNGIHLSHISKISPTLKLKRRTHYVNLVTLKKRYPKVTHVVVKVLPTEEPVSLHFDIHNPMDRSLTLQVPRWFSLSRTNIIQRTEPGTIRHEINLLGLQHVIQSYLLYIEPINCEAEFHHSTATLNIPWENHDSHGHFTEISKKPFVIRLHGSRPSMYHNLTAKLILNLDPKCQYTVTIRNSFFGMLGQFARFYSSLLIANIAAVILMSYRSQLLSLHENKYCSLFQSSLSMSTKPYYLVTSAKLLSKILSMLRIKNTYFITDTQVLVDENLDFLILPLLLYVTSVGITYLVSLAVWAGIIMNESTVHKFVGKAFSRALGKSFRMSDWFLKALHRVPCVVAATLFCLGLTTCGGLALCLGVCYYFLKLSQLGEDFVEGLIYRHVKKVAVGIVKNFFTKIGKLLFRKYVKKEEENQIAIEDTKNKEAENEMEKDLLESDDKTTEQTKIDETEQVKQNKEDETNDEETIDTITNEESTGKTKDEEESDDNETSNEQIVKENDTNSLRLRKVHLNTIDDTDLRTDENKSTSEIHKTVQQMFESPDNSEMHFHFTMFLMWSVVAALNIPSVLTWAHNFKYNNILSPDPSAFYAIILCACAVPLWQFEFPKPNKKFYREMAMFVYAMALLALIYTPFNLYRLSYIICTTFIITILHQIFAPSYPEEETNEDDKIDPIALIKEIKSKLE